MTPYQVRIVRTPPKKTVSMRILSPLPGQVEVEVRAPRRVTEEFITSFVRERRDWIEKQVKRLSRAHRESAELLPLRAQKEVAQLFSIRYRTMLNTLGFDEHKAPRLSIRSMKSRWGSYRTGTHSISLNTALARTPVELLDYVIAHELAHVAHHHHGPSFYGELSNFLPDWQERRKQLRAYEHSLLNDHASL